MPSGEIDASCELIDFWRFNAHYEQILVTATSVANRHLEPLLSSARRLCFAVAIQFTSIAINLQSVRQCLEMYLETIKYTVVFGMGKHATFD